MHREYINDCIPDPFVYEIGDYVWARRQIKSNKAKGDVGQLYFQQTGPWEITSIKPGRLYELRHCHKNNTKDKKKATELSPNPLMLITIFSHINYNASLRWM